MAFFFCLRVIKLCLAANGQCWINDDSYLGTLILDHTHSHNRESRLAQLVERVTSNDEVSRSSRLAGKRFYSGSNHLEVVYTAFRNQVSRSSRLAGKRFYSGSNHLDVG